MATVELRLAEGESLLDALLRHDLAVGKGQTPNPLVMFDRGI